MTHPVLPQHMGRGFCVLTESERQIAADLCTGAHRGEIAKRRGISVKTVDSFRHRLLKKVGVRNNVELALAAIRTGFISMHDGTTTKGTP